MPNPIDLLNAISERIWTLATKNRETIQPLEVLDIGIYFLATQKSVSKTVKRMYMLKSTNGKYNTNWQFLINNPHPV